MSDPLTMVAEDGCKMKKPKPTKVPVMTPNQQHVDWKKELRVWEATNTTLGVEPKIQAGTLFQSLEGVARKVVLSELSVEQITDSDGVENILKTLDYYFTGNEIQNSFNAIHDLMNYKCGKDVSVKNFLIDFQLKVNKVKETGTTLSDDILGYALLNSANLPEEREDIVKATCDELTFKK